MYAIRLEALGSTHWLASESRTAAETCQAALASAGHNATVWLAGKCLTPPAIIGLEVSYPSTHDWLASQH